MDPTTNPMPTPQPVSPAQPPVAPVSPAAPVQPAEPVQVTTPEQPAIPVQPVESVATLVPPQSVEPAQPSVEPVQPTEPVQAAGPTQPSTEPVQPAESVQFTPPVNPIINPAASKSADLNPTPVSPVFAPNGGGMVAATDPITMPAPPKAPDPIEEELKAPLKAAEPVPGSIGSAISVPPAENASSQAETDVATALSVQDSVQRTPSVSFTDPATTENPLVNSSAQPVKKKSKRTTLIALSIVAGMVAIALAAVLILQLTGTIKF